MFAGFVSRYLRVVSREFHDFNPMNVTYLGHSTFLMEGNGFSLLFDPFITPNPAAASVDINALNPTHILVSHGHFDHVVDVEAIARKSNAVIVSTFEIVSHFEQKDLKGHPMNIGGEWNFGTFSVKCVNAVHSSVLPDGSYAGNPMGFVLRTEGKTFYYSGDTALHMDMKLLGETETLDAAFLALGDNFTMGYKDAVIAADFIKCNHIIGMHFDTFPYIKIDHAKAKQAFGEKGKTLQLPSLGETFEL